MNLIQNYFIQSDFCNNSLTFFSFLEVIPDFTTMVTTGRYPTLYLECLSHQDFENIAHSYFVSVYVIAIVFTAAIVFVFMFLFIFGGAFRIFCGD